MNLPVNYNLKYWFRWLGSDTAGPVGRCWTSRVWALLWPLTFTTIFHPNYIKSLPYYVNYTVYLHRPLVKNQNEVNMIATFIKIKNSPLVKHNESDIEILYTSQTESTWIKLEWTWIKLINLSAFIRTFNVHTWINFNVEKVLNFQTKFYFKYNKGLK